MTKNRIENDGGSYGFYTRERAEVNYEPTSVEAECFVSSNRVENGKKGLPLGGNQYLHEGRAPEDNVQTALPKEYESGNQNSRIHGYSRLEHEHSASDFDAPDETIISATPKFDFISGRAELVVEFANRKQQVISASNKDVLKWVQNELIRRLV